MTPADRQAQLKLAKRPEIDKPRFQTFVGKAKNQSWKFWKTGRRPQRQMTQIEIENGQNWLKKQTLELKTILKK